MFEIFVEKYRLQRDPQAELNGVDVVCVVCLMSKKIRVDASFEF